MVRLLSKNNSYFSLSLDSSPVLTDGKCKFKGELAKAVQNQYGGLDGLKSAVNATAMGIQGSGWAWLVSNDKVFFKDTIRS